MDNVSFFDGANRFVIDKPIRLIELFAGIGAQAKALERIIGGGSSNTIEFASLTNTQWQVTTQFTAQTLRQAT